MEDPISVHLLAIPLIHFWFGRDASGKAGMREGLPSPALPGAGSTGLVALPRGTLSLCAVEISAAGWLPCYTAKTLGSIGNLVKRRRSCWSC